MKPHVASRAAEVEKRRVRHIEPIAACDMWEVRTDRFIAAVVAEAEPLWQLKRESLKKI